jgi:platelet-activating factor acetylhydrolase IB subunit alpha
VVQQISLFELSLSGPLTFCLSISFQIMELETRNAQLTEELAASPSSRRAASLTDWVPRNPPRHTLQGHRSPITRVAFHPVFSQIASCSEDATIKIWDWETGEFERTLKSHTKPVQDVDFDSTGNLLGKSGHFFHYPDVER